MADFVPEIGESPNQIEKAKRLLRNGCGCSRGYKEVQCSRNFSKETVLSNLNNCLELTAAELDLVVLANIQVFSRDKYIGGKRSRSSRCNYQYRSILICKEMFLHLYGISDSRLCRLKEHYDKYGIFPRTHCNTKRLPSNTLPQLVTENVHNFLANYVKENAIVLPGRIPGFKSNEVKVLPSSKTKMSVWRAYTSTCEASGVQAVSYSKFAELWPQSILMLLCPNR